MRNYELTYIVASDVDETEFGNILNQVTSWVETGSGKVAKVDQWGRRRLAYPISEYTEGYYVTLALELNPAQAADLERNLRLAEKVLRHLLIRADEK